MNWGDAGLRRLFDKVFDILSPGGIFILEPQPWKSYKQAIRKQDMPVEVRTTLSQLKIKPQQFQNILIEEVGFSQAEQLGLPNGSTQGFDRPLILFRKFVVPGK